MDVEMKDQTSAPATGAADGADTGPDVRQPNSHGCFVCGLANPVGLKIVFSEDREQQLVYAELDLSEAYRSYPGVVHGGILCTILDEVLFRTSLIEGSPWMVTARMEVRFKAPVPTEKPLTASAEVTNRKRRILEATGEIRLEDGTLAVEADATFVRIPEDSIVSFDEEIDFWEVE